MRRLLSHTAGLGLHGYTGFTAGRVSTTESLDGEHEGCCLREGSYEPGNGDTRIDLPPGSQFSYSGMVQRIEIYGVKDQRVENLWGHVQHVEILNGPHSPFHKVVATRCYS